MRRLAWMIALGLAAHAGYEIHSHGFEGAFGGRFASYLEPLEPAGATPDNFEPPH
jgi:hypothetical protein